jgi:hypothetical protein
MSLPSRSGETNLQHSRRRNALFRKNKTAASNEFMANLRRQWPCKIPTKPSGKNIETYLDMSVAMSRVIPSFATWHDNGLFLGYLDELSSVLARAPILNIPKPHYELEPSRQKQKLSDESRYCSIMSIFAAPAPAIALGHNDYPSEPEITIVKKLSKSKASDMGKGLKSFCKTLGALTKLSCERDYVKSFRASCTALEEHTRSNKTWTVPADCSPRELLHQYLEDCMSYYQNLNNYFAEIVAGEPETSNCVATYIQHIPRFSPTFG